MQRTMNLLPQVAFSILLALSLRPRHGYEIIKQVDEDSLGKIRLSAGSLYGSIKQLRAEKLIVERAADNKNERRRYYELTPKGRAALAAELDYFKQSVVLANQRQIMASTPS